MSPKNMTVYSRFCAGRGLACKRCKRAPPRRVRLGIFAELFRCSQRALAVNHGSDQTGSKAIAGRHQFADILVVEFRDLAPGARKLRQHPGLVDNLFDHDACVGGRLGSNVVGDGVDILKRAPRPGYSVSHLLRRVSTSARESVPLTGASSSPRRTL